MSDLILGGPCRVCGRPNHGPYDCKAAETHEHAAIGRIVDLLKQPKERDVSFSFEFVAKTADVSALLDVPATAQNHAPACVKEFIRAAVSGLPHEMVSVKANGHLFNKDYQTSTATIEVKPLILASV